MKLRSRKQESKKKLNDFISELITVAETNLAEEKISAGEIFSVKKATRDLPFCSDELIRFFDENNDGGALIDHLYDIIYGAAIIGSTVFGSDTTSKLLLAEARQIQARIASEANKASSEAKNAKLMEIIKAVAAEHNRALAASEKFAGLIRPDVRERLGYSREGDGYPSVRQIKDAVRSMKKNRSKSQALS